MDEPPTTTIELTPEMLIAVNQLVQILGRKKFLRLAQIIMDGTEHGWGSIKIGIGDHRVVWLRSEKSYNE